MVRERKIRPVASEAEVMPVRRVRKAYEQVNDQLRELIVSGELPPGARLPNEAVLAREFGVSRATVREALRILTAQNLIRTTKGAGGGSYVTLPTVDHISEFLRGNLNLLSESEHVTLEEFLELRELIEVPAARLAASRSSTGDLERLREAIPEQPLRMTTQEQFVYNKGFHTVIVEACGNTLLYIAAQPVFTVLQTHLARSSLGRSFHRSINEHHHRILDAIEAGDADGAAREMQAHLEYLRPAYERAWRHAVSMRKRA
jgi:GntR family transcriptional regulator, transcriptional repressor for pyruvate dehydrogenase complex